MRKQRLRNTGNRCRKPINTQPTTKPLTRPSDEKSDRLVFYYSNPQRSLPICPPDDVQTRYRNDIWYQIKTKKKRTAPCLPVRVSDKRMFRVWTRCLRKIIDRKSIEDQIDRKTQRLSFRRRVQLMGSPPVASTLEMDSASSRRAGSSASYANSTRAYSPAINSGQPSATTTSVETSMTVPFERLLFPASLTSMRKYSSSASITSPPPRKHTAYFRPPTQTAHILSRPCRQRPKRS